MYNVSRHRGDLENIEELGDEEAHGLFTLPVRDMAPEIDSHALAPCGEALDAGHWRSSAPDLSLDLWPNRPCLVTQAPSPSSSCQAVPVDVGDELRVSSDLFEGRAFVYVDGAGTPAGHPVGESPFGGRRSSFTLRGRFKRRVRFSDLVIGHEFNDGVIDPPGWQRSLILGFLRRFFPHLKVTLGARTSALAPVLLECKRLRVSRPGDEGRELERLDVPEDTGLLGGFFAERPRSPRERARYFRRRENTENHHFEPDLEYTFEFYQNNLSFVDYKLRFGMFSLGIGRITKGRPVQFLIKDVCESEYLCYFEVRDWSGRAGDDFMQSR